MPTKEDNVIPTGIAKKPKKMIETNMIIPMRLQTLVRLWSLFIVIMFVCSVNPLFGKYLKSQRLKMPYCLVFYARKIT